MQRLRFVLVLLAAGLVLAGGAAPLYAQAPAGEATWRDPEVPTGERVRALMESLTTSEKIALLDSENPAIERLEIPAYDWWNEALHGVARAGRATVFPQAINLAATFDDSLVHRVATAISDEARAKFNVAQRLGNRGRYRGLTFWSPNINIFRDLRWGRGQETYGEDPFLTSQIGTAFVRGMQGDHPRYLKTAAAAKHFAVYSGPEANRHSFDAQASQQDLRQTYLPAFEALVREAGVAGVMCSYNRINGVPACASEEYLQSLLRDEWGFGGYVVSDCFALSDIVSRHEYTETAEEAAALALEAGVNVNCGNLLRDHLPAALDQGRIAEADVDGALAGALPTLFRLGLFDDPGAVPWSDLGPEVVASEPHRRLARTAAERSLVLLKNDARGDDRPLPLSPDLRSLAVIGPTAASEAVLWANYHGLSSDLTTFLEGLTGAVSVGTTLTYEEGVPLSGGDAEPEERAVTVSQEADAIVAFVGLGPSLEGEGYEMSFNGETSALGLPSQQVALVEALREDYDGPLVVVVTGSSPRAIPEVHELADAVIWAGYPGQAGGDALARVLFGETNPSGRLPVTVPYAAEDLPPYDDYSMEGRTYRFMEEAPLYPFGFGLGYTQFSYHDLHLSRSAVAPGDSLQATVTLENMGDRAGREAVQLYVTDEDASTRVPRASLRGVDLVSLAPGATREVTFTIPPEALQVIGEDGTARHEAGRYEVVVGGASPGARAEALGAATPARAHFQLRP